MAVEASVIIPTYNRRRILQKALLALGEQTYPANLYEVVVVDDGSTDGTGEMVNSLQVPYSLVYLKQERGGPAKARNRAIEAASGELCIFIDSDIVVVSEFIEAHVMAHRRRPKVVANGPVIHTSDIDNPSSAQMKITDVSRAFFATGNTSVEKRYLVEAGMFDEDFIEYGWEDLELGHRLKKLGLKAVKVPEAKGFHYKPKLRLEDLPYHRQRERERAHTAHVFYRKHPSFKVRVQLEMVGLAFALDRLIMLGGWQDWAVTMRLLHWLEEKGWHWALRFLVRLITHHEYMEGLREGDRQGSVKQRSG